MTNFENIFWDLRHKYFDLYHENPQDTTIKTIYYELFALNDEYEKCKNKKKEDDKQSVKSLLNTIIRVLHDDNE